MPVTRKLRPRTTPAPSGLVAIPSASQAVELSWNYSNPPFDFTRFDIYRDGVLLDDVTETSYNDATAADGVEYDYTIVAVRTNPHSSVIYRSAPSNTAAGSWSSGASADVSIVSMTNATAGPTIAVKPVTGASLYQFERSPDPLTGFAEIAEQAGTSFQDTTATAGTVFFYRYRADNGSPSQSRAGTKTIAGADTIIFGDLELRANERSITVILPYTGDANRSAEARIEYSGDGGTTWKHALPPDQWNDGTRARITGSITRLTPGTPYIVRVTVSDTGGGPLDGFKQGTIDTRAAVGSATAYASRTHLLAPSGGNWTTQADAVSAANAASGDMVIGIENGYYRRSTATITGNGHAIQFVAETPSIGAPASYSGVADTTDYAPIAATTPVSIDDPGCVIFYDAYSAPTGSSDSGSMGTAPWNSTVVNGVTTYYATAPFSNCKQVAFSPVVGGDYAAAKAATPIRVGNWGKSGTLLQTSAGFLDVVTTNHSYAAGHWQSGSTTVYLRLPGDVNPNNCYVWLSGNTAASGEPLLDFNGSDLRVSGVRFRVAPAGIMLRAACVRPTIDHCLFEDGEQAMHLKAGTGDTTATDITWEYNRVVHTELWKADPVSDRGIPWTFVKQRLILEDGTLYTTNRVGSASETQGIKMLKAGRGMTVRYSTFENTFNCVGANSNNTNPNIQCDVDVHNCLFIGIADNAIEPEGACSNWRVWDCVLHDGRNMYSTDFSHGPFYGIQNRMLNWGVQGITDHGEGFGTLNIPGTGPPPATQTPKAGFGQLVKYGSGRTPGPLIFMLNETAWTTEAGSKGWTDAVGSPFQERWYIRNVIARVATYVTQNVPLANWNEDGSFFASADTADAMNVGAKDYASAAVTGDNSVADYRDDLTPAATITNKHSGTDYNFITGGVTLIDTTLLTDPENGDLSLAVASAGIPLPNVQDDGTANRGFEG